MAQAAPVLPSEFEELIPNPNDDECEVLRKLFAFEVLVHRWYKFAFDSTGDFTEAFILQICEAHAKCYTVKST